MHRSPAELESAPQNLALTEENFESVLRKLLLIQRTLWFLQALALMDVWASKADSQALFHKYSQGDRQLSAHEFIRKIRPNDHDNSVNMWNKEPLARAVGKRIGYAERSGGSSVDLSVTIPSSPSSGQLSVNRMGQSLRDKFKMKHPCHQVCPGNRILQRTNVYVCMYPSAHETDTDTQTDR
jgi:hypothetical protein